MGHTAGHVLMPLSPLPGLPTHAPSGQGTGMPGKKRLQGACHLQFF